MATIPVHENFFEETISWYKGAILNLNSLTSPHLLHSSSIHPPTGGLDPPPSRPALPTLNHTIAWEATSQQFVGFV